MAINERKTLKKKGGSGAMRKAGRRENNPKNVAGGAAGMGEGRSPLSKRARAPKGQQKTGAGYGGVSAWKAGGGNNNERENGGVKKKLGEKRTGDHVLTSM